jgi:hypothetical protein
MQSAGRLPTAGMVPQADSPLRGHCAPLNVHGRARCGLYCSLYDSADFEARRAASWWQIACLPDMHQNHKDDGTPKTMRSRSSAPASYFSAGAVRDFAKASFLWYSNNLG